MRRSIDQAELAGIRARLRLQPDGEAFATNSSWLQPVTTAEGEPAMLKVARADYERTGGVVMAGWAGRGAARVLALTGDALVLERLATTPSLANDLAEDTATRAICAVVERLHCGAIVGTLEVDSLVQRFKSLELAAGQDNRFSSAWSVARRLLAEPREVVLLHGDIHHGNLLWGGDDRGWLAIDPQAAFGERTYDYANLLKNPWRSPEVMLAPGRLRRVAEVIADAATLPIDRVLAFGQAHAALSAAWSLDDGEDPTLALAMSEIARRELG